MKINIIQGEFGVEDAMDLISQMIHIKIRFHENKISVSESEEDKKYRETKIKNLQKELFDWREYIKSKSKSVKMNAIINIE